MNRLLRPCASLAFISALALAGAQTYKLKDLGLNGGLLSGSLGVNNSNQVERAFLYTGGTMMDLGALSGGTSSEAYGINASGHVVGISSVAGSTYHAFLYTGWAMVDLGTLGGSMSGAAGINASDEVVGDAFTASSDDHAFLYSGGVMHDLGTLGGPQSNAESINTSGQIVGQSMINNTTGRGFLYSGGVMRNINSLLDATGHGWTVTDAHSINDSGAIAGTAVGPDGYQHAVLLTPGLHRPPPPVSIHPG